MPIYEYRCNKCGEQFEVRQSIGADGSTLKCPVCNAEKPQKMISTFSSLGTSSDSGFGASCSPSSGST